ncbi:MAG: DNA repair protein RecN [Alphaproteobacteria bacterium]
MITSLNINNIVLVEKTKININNGLTALTGETGAGKSILLDAIGLVIGGRGDSTLVRRGTEKAIISAEFELDTQHPVFNTLNEYDIEFQNNEPLILKRIITNDGKSRCYINGQPVNVKNLRNIGELLVDVQGQFEQHGLLSPKRHMDILDNYCLNSMLKQKTAEAYYNWKKSQDIYQETINEYNKIKQDEEYIIHCLEELKNAELKENEEQELLEYKNKLKNADKLLQSYNESYNLLNSDQGIESLIIKAEKQLEKISSVGGEELQNIIKKIDFISTEALEIKSLIQEEAEKLQESAHCLQVVEDRLYMLSDLAKKHRCSVDDLINIEYNLQIQANLLQDNSGEILQLKQNLELAKNKYLEYAKELSNIRVENAQVLSSRVNRELPTVALNGAEFLINVKTEKNIDLNTAKPSGLNTINFMAKTNIGMDFSPIHKSASGGELSRMLLAINVALAEKNTACTLLFDEVDSGVGGSSAHSIGIRLKNLAQTHQVIVITHSPQVAGIANNHFFIKKTSDESSTYTEIKSLDKNTRINEIARMLSSDKITDESKQNAKSLMGV